MGRTRENRKSGGQDRPTIALVLLLSEPRFLDEKSLAKLVEKAWGLPANWSQKAGNSGKGKSPLLRIHAEGRAFVVQNVDAPYFDEPKKAAQEMRELRLRKVVAEHRAWLSVEYYGSEKGESAGTIYQLIGKLIAELCDNDCLAVLCPATGGINIYDDEIRLGLCEKNPMELLSSFSHAPVLSVSQADPRMRQAVAEARKRWPEFVGAFENRSADQHFSVRAPFGDGQHTEFMWVGVTAIENDIIYGELGNEPLWVRGMSAGETVKVRVGDMNDWMFTEGERMRGGFTIEAIRQAEGDGK
ncbi:MAG TPA: DUF2314 domain-containing protein [Tepidisphaeraceae bacterium]|jgi:uncharacterized protein YegJ (DUF2314 family)|nr:DUF2314 domain-containing protein [Tepidisphaeraceae bacterium]